ncbi:acyl carrier protein [Streptomyces sp. NBC_00237]|uniref:acyl carrier protein n=1 Tax=Streptomyces sp. NBC_00237 TaxID=2975687 RepID=UPI00225C1607|nr:acyl carrier protein [Streptomyces sp. NBC_00237]MCX5205884.1 acyl carrier protein [Streptomyces sp. NBC_00237]
MPTVEQRVAGIWREILDLNTEKDLGPEDDFFGLGGTSLQAMNLVQRLREEFDAPVALSALLVDASLRAVGAAVKAAGPGDLEAARP